MVHGHDLFRLGRIKRELARAGIRHAHIHTHFQANNLNASEVSKFFIETKASSSSDDEGYKACVDVYRGTITEKSPEKKCSGGIKLDNRVIAVGMEHYNIIKTIAECQEGHAHCASLSNNPLSR